MDYLKPIETLEKVVSYQKKMIMALVILLAISFSIGPYLAKEANPILVQTDNGFALSKVEPWKLAVSRIEAFSKAYISARFEWDEATFSQKKKLLSVFCKKEVFLKLKDSTQAFESLINGQKAKSFFILEGFAFSNGQQKIEMRITRVLRIQDSAIATPLVIRLAYDEAPISPDNPYGLIVSGVDESEPQSNGGDKS